MQTEQHGCLKSGGVFSHIMPMELRCVLSHWLYTLRFQELEPQWHVTANQRFWVTGDDSRCTFCMVLWVARLFCEKQKKRWVIIWVWHFGTETLEKNVLTDSQKNCFNILMQFWPQQHVAVTHGFVRLFPGLYWDTSVTLSFLVHQEFILLFFFLGLLKSETNKLGRQTCKEKLRQYFPFVTNWCESRLAVSILLFVSQDM